MQASTQNKSDGLPSADSLRLLEQQLGIEADELARWCGECEIFSELCADYEACCVKLDQLEQEGRAVEESARQYTEMRNLLKADLARCREGLPPCRCREQPWRQQKTVG